MLPSDLIGGYKDIDIKKRGSMYALSLLERWLGRNCSAMHLGRRRALVKVLGALLRGGKAMLTDIGRHVGAGSYEKHGIKCADRLLGNRLLHAGRLDVYRAVAQWLLSQTPRPWIIVDWSDVEVGRRHRFLMLKAAVPVGGRALTIYEEVHPLKRFNNPKTHRRFLENLHAVLPSHCCPIVITDAGFRGPWFEAVSALGWDWIGRVRNRVNYQLSDDGKWHPLKSLYARARHIPTYLGQGWLSSKQPYACQLHLVQGFKRGPGRPRKALRVKPNQRKTRTRAREPWVLATSLSAQHWSAKRVVGAYQKRMQIEETFRDLKSHRWGYSLQYARSNSAQRLENLLLLTTLATLSTWLVGLAAKSADLVKHFQANTEKRWTVLSLFFVGRRILKSTTHWLSPQAIREAMKALPEVVSVHSQYA
jgi:Transposase DDE domain